MDRESVSRALYAFEAIALGTPTLLVAVLLFPFSASTVPMYLYLLLQSLWAGQPDLTLLGWIVYLLGAYVGLTAWCWLSYRYLRGGVAALVQSRRRLWGALAAGVPAALLCVANLVWGGFRPSGPGYLALTLAVMGPGMLVPALHLALVRVFHGSGRSAATHCPQVS